MEIKALDSIYFPQVLEFTDKYIGKNYFNTQDLEKVLKKSLYKNQNSSLLAFIDNTLVGVRLTYMPQIWINSPDLKIHPNLWPVDKNAVGYFKSLFVDPNHQSQGIGVTLSAQSLNILKSVGAKAVVTHCWVESPNNSSFNYLSKMGFKEVFEIKKAWSHIDYDCVVCTPKKCFCTAKEMILNLEKP